MKSFVAAACVATIANAYIVPAAETVESTNAVDFSVTESQLAMILESLDNENWAAVSEFSAEFESETEVMDPNGLNVRFIPKFIAGFFRGFTGVNHLNELNACMKDLDTLHQDIHNFIQSAKNKDIGNLVINVGTMFTHIPGSVRDCVHVKNDIKDTLVWAKQFIHPKDTVKKATMNFLRRFNDIEPKFHAQKSQWNSKQFFEAGERSAEILSILVGTVHSNDVAFELDSADFNKLPNIKMVPQFLAGMFKEFDGVNHLTELQTCTTGVENLGHNIRSIVDDLKNKKIGDAVIALGQFLTQVPAATNSCKHIGDDVKSLALWSKQFLHPKEATEKITLNFLRKFNKLEPKLNEQKNHFQKEEYSQAGAIVSDILVELLGPVKSNELVEANKLPNIKMVPQFFAGMFKEFDGINHLTELQTCMTGVESLGHDIKAVMGDLKNKQIGEAIIALGDLLTHVPAATTNCIHIGDDVRSLGAWGKQFLHPKQTAEKITLNFLRKFNDLEPKLKEQKTHFKSEEYSKAGAIFSDILVELLGPVKENENAVANLNLKLVPQFFSGFFKEFDGINHLNELGSCLNSVETLEHDIKGVVENMKEKKIGESIIALGTMITHMPTATHNCIHIGADLRTLAHWSKQFLHPKEFAETATLNFLRKFNDLEPRIHEQKTHWHNKEFEQVGRVTADVLVEIIGTVRANDVDFDIDFALLQ